MKCKRILSFALAAAMLFGSAALLPEGTFSFGTGIKASASTSMGYTYTVLSDDSAMITECDVTVSSEETVIIPDHLDGHKVTCLSSDPEEERNIFNGYNTIIKTIIIPDTVEKIGDYAFGGLSALTSITIPDSVNSIGEQAFCNCKSLKSITIPCSTGPDSFAGCDNLENVTFLDGATSIEGFAYCKSLKSISLPASIIEIGWYTFEYCPSLESITLPDSVRYIGTHAFEGSALKSINIPNGLSVIENKNAFSKCDKLVDLTVDMNLSKFFELNGGINIGKITSLTLGKNVTNIDASELESFTSLNDLQVDPDNLYYSSVDGVLYNKDKTKIVYISKNATSLTIPDGTTAIEDNAFEGYKNLESVIIPNSVTTIGKSAFSGCSSLKSVTIPNSVKSIGAYAFDGCTNLTSVTIPSSIKSIGTEAFLGCSSLEKVTFGSGKTRLGESSFSDCGKLTELVIENDFSDFLGNDVWLNMSFGYVTKLGLGKGVSDFDRKIFDYYPKINEINVDPENPYYSSVDGVLYNKDKTKPICCPRSKTSVVIPDGVTEIGDEAFLNCKDLESITIPKSVVNIGKDAFTGTKWFDDQKESSDTFVIANGILLSVKTDSSIVKIPSSVKIIGANAFTGCDTVKAVTIPNGVVSIGAAAFMDCPNLASATIPNSVKSIGNEAFENCRSLRNATIPNSVTSIGDKAFSGCSSLTGISIPDSVTIIGIRAFEDCPISAITIPSGVTSIGDNAFSDCPITSLNIPDNVKSLGALGIGSLKKIAIGSGITEIDEKMFSGCGSLESISISTKNKNYSSIDGILYNKDKTKIVFCPHAKTNVTIPDSVTSIDENTFKGCTAIKTLTIGNGIKELTKVMLKDCRNLSELTLGTGITSVSDEQFKGLNNLTNVTFNGKVTSIGESAFEECSNLRSINLSDSLTSIGDGAFMNCASLQSVTIPDNVGAIGGYTFYFCSALESLKIGSGVKTIGDGAFSHCSNLTSITIGNSVETIGQYAFDGCTSLFSLIIPDSVKGIDYGAFISCEKLTEVTIPQSVNVVGGYAFGYVDYQANSENSQINNAFAASAEFASVSNDIQADLYDKVKGFRISCYKGSAGEEYAKNNKFSYQLIDVIYVDKKDATCMKNGNIEYWKYKNNYYSDKYATKKITKDQITIKALGHDYVETVVAPTCTKQGYTLHKCSRCGDSYKDTYKDATGHNWSKWTTTKAATCTADGVQTRKCTVCGKIETKTIAKTGHKFSAWKTTSFNLKNKTSTQTRKCSACGKTETQTNKNAVTRLAGANRYETASVISTKMYPKTSGTVIIATGLTFHDAMVAVPLASAYNAPLLLATEKHITAQTEAELKRLGAKNVIVVSTNGAIGAKAKAEFKAAKYSMTYIEGKTCFETAAKVAKALQTKTKTAPDTIFFATDSAFADALSASPVAAIKGAPIMYLKNKGSIDSATANYLKSVKGKVKNAYIIGGAGVISDAMMKNVAKALGLTVNKTVQRVAGKNRYETCTAVNNKFKSVLTGDGICVAKGLDFPDALAGGVYAAATKQALFLADGKKLQDCQNTYLKSKNAGKLTVFGGTGAVPDDLVKLIAKASV